MALLLECMHGRPRPQARSGICLFLISYFSILPNSYPYNLRRQALELEPTACAEEEERSSSLAADLNREAHDAALGLVADSARQRYESRGRRLRFPPDRRAPGGTRRREPRGHPAAASHARSRLPALCAGGSALRARLAAPGRQPVLRALRAVRGRCLVWPQASARRRICPAKAQLQSACSAAARACSHIPTRTVATRTPGARPSAARALSPRTVVSCRMLPTRLSPLPRLAPQGCDARGRHAGAVGGAAPAGGGRRRARACRGVHSPTSCLWCDWKHRRQQA